jgi:hypothetical protein
VWSALTKIRLALVWSTSLKAPAAPGPHPPFTVNLSPPVPLHPDTLQPWPTAHQSHRHLHIAVANRLIDINFRTDLHLPPRSPSIGNMATQWGNYSGMLIPRVSSFRSLSKPDPPGNCFLGSVLTLLQIIADRRRPQPQRFTLLILA